MSGPTTSTASPALPAEAVLPATAAGVKKAAELLRQGKLVVLPTETVYGIALNLTSEAAREAAREIKARAAEGAAASASPWVIHVASAEELLSWVPGISPLGRRLVTKSLPGPVAFEIKLAAAAEAAARQRLGGAHADETLHDGYLTLRCPEMPATQDVLATVGAPVAIIGAGTRSQPAVYELGDLSRTLFPPEGDMGGSRGATIHAGIDGGPTRYRRSSTLVRIDGQNYSVVRQGVIDERILHRMADLTILFLCTGNTCRSPMAAALATKLLTERLRASVETARRSAAKPLSSVEELRRSHMVVQSAGLHATHGLRATREAQDAVKELGGDLSAHISQPATADGGALLRRADVIYTMTAAHRHEVLDLFPWTERKTFRLDPEGDISDPIGAPFAVYQRVARRLAAVVQQRLDELPL